MTASLLFRENALALALAGGVLVAGGGVATLGAASPGIALLPGAALASLAVARLAFSALDRVRTAEAEMRAIIERAADGIITADDEGLIESVNKAAETIFGYRESELQGLSVSTLLSSVYEDPEGASLWEFLRTNAIGMTGAAQEVIGLRRSGEAFFMDLAISQAEVGDRSLFIAIARDVTDKKKSELALRQAHDQLERRVEERTAELQSANEQLVEEVHRREQVQNQQSQTLAELKQAMKDIKTLSGLIPICSSCKKVRDDDGFWNQIESYITDHSDAMFSHGICPDCKEVLYPGLGGDEPGAGSEKGS